MPCKTDSKEDRVCLPAVRSKIIQHVLCSLILINRAEKITTVVKGTLTLYHKILTFNDP